MGLSFLWKVWTHSSKLLQATSCKLQAAKRANKSKVHVPQAQDPMVLIGELVKAKPLFQSWSW